MFTMRSLFSIWTIAEHIIIIYFYMIILCPMNRGIDDFSYFTYMIHCPFLSIFITSF